jgi:hypothetical protein
MQKPSSLPALVSKLQPEDCFVSRSSNTGGTKGSIFKRPPGSKLVSEEEPVQLGLSLLPTSAIPSQPLYNWFDAYRSALSRIEKIECVLAIQLRLSMTITSASCRSVGIKARQHWLLKVFAPVVRVTEPRKFQSNEAEVVAESTFSKGWHSFELQRFLWQRSHSAPKSNITHT